MCDNGDAFFDVDGEQTVERLLTAVPALADQRQMLESLLIRLPKMRQLAASTAPGDLIAFLDVGAYTLDQFTPNNGRSRPEVGMLDRGGPIPHRSPSRYPTRICCSTRCSDVSRPRSLADVAARGLCTGCGLCAGAATPGRVSMSMTREGFLRPMVARDIDPIEHARLLSLCPGNRIALRRDARVPHLDAAWGGYLRLLKGHSTDPEVRFLGASGGVISAIAEFLLQSGRVDFVLHIAADPAAALRTRVQLSRSRMDVMAAAGARYASGGTPREHRRLVVSVAAVRDHRQALRYRGRAQFGEA